MKTVLTLPPKQIFSSLFGLPIIIGFFFLAVGYFVSINWIKYFFFSVPTLLALSGFFGWLWVIGTSTNHKVNPEIRMQSRLFKVGLIYAWIYSTINILYVSPKFISVGISFLDSTEYMFSSLCSFVAVFYMPYAIYFIAKNIVMAEEQKEIKFKDFADVFYSFLFLPSGIWVAQTRVQKLFQVEKE
jgi:hypothetical protein